jgi:hypothetical protein
MDRWSSLSRVAKAAIVIVVLFVMCGVIGLLMPEEEPAGTARQVPTASQAESQGAVDVGAKSAPAAQESESGTSQEAEQKPAPTEVRPTEVQMPGLGDTVKVGKTRWKVDVAEDLGQTVASGNQFIDDLQTSGKFIGVGLIFANDDNDSMFVPEPAIVDDAGREFEPSSDAFMIIDDSVSCVLEEVNPGLTQECYWIYEVPTSATGLKLRVKSSSFFADTEDIDLGL